MSSTRRTGTIRTGGRSARVVTQVLSAAVHELSRSGYDSFRVDAVASAAGVNKTSVYRRWPNKLALVAAALRARPISADPVPDEGTLRGDLVHALERTSDYCASNQFRDTAAMLQSSDPELNELVAELRREFYAKHIPVVDRAILRGELPANTDGLFMLETLFTQAIALTLRRKSRLDPQQITRLVELVVRGAEHGGAPKPV